MPFIATTTKAACLDDATHLWTQLTSHKVVLVRQACLDPARHEPDNSFEAMARRMQSMGEALGTFYPTDEDLTTGQPTGRQWIDITYDPLVPNRNRTTPVAQPLHTDFSYVDVPDVLQMMWCEKAAPRGGASTFIDADEIVELLLLDGQHALLDRLQATAVTFSKAPRRRRQTILHRQADGWHFNWNYYCLDQHATAQERQLVEDFHHFLQDRVVAAGLPTPVYLQRGDLVLFHDERVLHGRQAYFAHRAGDRRLHKGTLLLNQEALTQAR